MKEVSCRVLDLLFRAAQRKEVSPDTLCEGLPYSSAYLQDNQNRIEWAVFCQFMRNTSDVFSPDELRQIGEDFFSSPLIRPFAVVARLLFTPGEFYEWLNRGPEGTGIGYQLFTCVRPHLRHTAQDRIELSLLMEEGYPPCPEFYTVTHGNLEAMPRLLGLGRARVEMRTVRNGAIYEIQYPRGGGAFSWMRRAIAWPFSARAAARYLKEANEQLQRRYEELDRAQQRLERQATQLRTAHSISQVIHKGLNLEATLDSVARALVEMAAFLAAEVNLSLDVEGQPIAQAAVHGQRPEGVEPIEIPLTLRGRQLGDLRLWPEPEADRRERYELLEYIVPAVYMAVSDALTFRSLVDYRDNLERKVARRTAELAAAHDNLAETIARLREAQDVRQRIFANINHEIRTPLSLITLAVADITHRRADELDPRTREQLDDIDRAVHRLLHLIDGLLLLAAGQESKLRLKFVRSDAAVMLRQLVAAWRTVAEHHRLELLYEGPERCAADFDEAAFERVTTNLVSNAIKFTPTDGTVRVRLNDRDDEIDVQVEDTGIGIDADFIGRVFERFEQGRPAVHDGARGSGIGLSIVKELVEAHGGRVLADQLSEGGSVFTVTLPKFHVETALSTSEISSSVTPVGNTPAFLLHPEAPSKRFPATPNRASEATVLLAEDDPELRRALVEVLSADYKVLQAGDGKTALELAEKHRPDLLVTDVGMPLMDGFALAERFCRLPGNRLAPVLMLTAYAGLENRLKGFEAGAVDYVVKPVEPRELRARVRSQLALRALALRLHESEKLASLGLLNAGLAHEIRNPVNAVSNAIAPLKRLLPPELRDPDHPVAQLLEAVEIGAQQLGHLSRELLGLAQPTEFKRAAEPVARMVHAAAALYRRLFPKIPLTVDLNWDGDIWGSKGELVQVLTNLLENAAQAAGEDGWVRLSVHGTPERVILEVHDSGPGVPPELRHKIFDPFFTTKAPGIGTGLGLTICRTIVNRYEGILEVAGGHEGTFFRLELPGQGANNALRAPTLSASTHVN